MRKAVLAGVGLFCSSAMIGFGFAHPFGDPRSRMAPKEVSSLLQDVQMPADAKAVLVTKCADCHSEATRWPAYAHIAPGSWLIERDVMEGRKHMNLSRWGVLTEDQRQTLQAKIVQRTKGGKMPPLQYLALHWTARLSEADLQALAKLSHDGGAVEDASTATGDAVRGEVIFNRRCTGCHTLDGNREGPRLRGVYGRKAGTVPGFTYSAALKAAGITWDRASLERWLSDTDAMVPDSAMGFRVVKSAERADLIAYLQQQSK